MSFTSLGNAQIARQLYRYDQVHQARPSPVAFTDEHVAQFSQLGFVAIENVFTPQEVQDAKDGLRFLIGGGNPAYDGVEFEAAAAGKNLAPDEKELYVRKTMHFVDFDTRLKLMSEQATFKAIVQRLLGGEARMIQDMALMKPPHVGREKPWHQDNAYFLYEPLEGIMGTWIALDAATAENGCMHVIPGTHAAGPKPHYHDRDCQLPDEDVDVRRDVIVPLGPGGALFFSSLLHHGTPPNTSSARRRALQFHYARTDCRPITPERHGELFRDAAGSAGCANWTPEAKSGRSITAKH